MELLLLTLLLLREIIQTNTEDGNYTTFLNPYSGEKLFNHSCIPDLEAFEIVKDLQLTEQEKANYLHENLCKIDAKLLCDSTSRRCVCMIFGGHVAVWDSTRVSCFGLVGSSCKTFTKFHPGMSKRLMHKTECVIGATCANFVYDTTEVCRCMDEKQANRNHRCTSSKNKTGGINLRQSSFVVLVKSLILVLIICLVI
ncbi:unnamed protein product [Allacma fusca]|uniref:Uncharacterized protein n=1 Tax=Allacma fusca TaxID=39272 RepID=A0A8J2NFR3_9HEXA|nr:unnamed protein product [Allacma fusca]